MIAATVLFDEIEGQAFFLTLPRIGETISIPILGIEKDLKVVAINHHIIAVDGCLKQVEIVLSCKKAAGIT